MGITVRFRTKWINFPESVFMSETKTKTLDFRTKWINFQKDQ